MFGKRLAIALASALVLTVCFGCGPHEAAHNHVDANNDGVCDDCGKNIGEDLPDVDSDREKETFKLSDYTDLPEVQFTSVRAVQETGSAKFKMTAKWTDRYEVEFSNKAVSLVEIFDKEGKLLKSERSAFDIQLDAGQTIFVRIVPVKKSARITVTAEENESPLPFDLVNVPDASSFKTTSDDPTVSPLEPAELKYVKRENTQYIYSNAPETLVPEVVNKCQTRQDVSNQSVYFTFEHQCREVGPVYYGYRVTNTGKEDMYVTVKNVGFQFDGSGAYLGEREWTDFYNTKFALPDIQSLSDSQQKLYEGFYGFSGQYVVHDFQPTTYRVPAGQYMYVMGGTTQDSFDAINVADTANRIARNAIVENGAVLFDVVGEAEGAFYIYNDISKVMPGGEGCNTHLGGTIQPEASCGNDVGYVVDNSAVWTFNDATAAQTLPVNYTNYYSDIVGTVRVEGPGGVEGMPNQPIEGTGPHRQLNKLEWVTHIDVQQKHEAIGTDVTFFHTVDSEGKPIVYGCNYYDSVGKLPNMGNWMKDFIDVFTFVNQGNNDRYIRINITPNGGMPVMLRTMDGKRVTEEGLAPFFALKHGSDKVGDAMYDGFDLACHYTFKVPAHSVIQYAVEYNLMANSNGYVQHSVELLDEA